MKVIVNFCTKPQTIQHTAVTTSSRAKNVGTVLKLPGVNASTNISADDKSRLALRLSDIKILKSVTVGDRIYQDSQERYDR